VTELVFYCKEGHHPVAAVDNGLCPGCGEEMTEIGWFGRASAAGKVQPECSE
jgi:hypothetical protein